MREIKFRLIRDNNIVGYEFHDFDMNNVYIMHSKTNDIEEAYNIAAVEEADIACDSKEQFTGLHDKNGKEIYEGDIIQWNIRDYLGGGISEIIWEKDLAQFGFKAPNQFGIWHIETADEFEVIGNIHENGDLLNDTDEQTHTS